MSCWNTRFSQLILAQVLTCIYSLIMMAVIVSILLQINKDGWYTPSSFFTLAIAGSMIMSAILHPLEVSCLFWGWLYWLVIPSMYLLLMIYSLVNMNDVTWGTREVLTKKSKEVSVMSDWRRRLLYFNVPFCFVSWKSS